MANLDTFHNMVLMHDIARSAPEEAEAACRAAGLTLDACRYPNSTFSSCVKCFKSIYNLEIGNTAGEAAVALYPLVQHDIIGRNGSTLSGGTVQTIMPDTVRLGHALYYRVVGKCFRFIPTQNMEFRSGTVAGCTFAGPGDQEAIATVTSLRELNWTETAPLAGGMHVVMAHGPRTVIPRNARQAHLEGIAPPYVLDTVNFSTTVNQQTYDPHTYRLFDSTSPGFYLGQDLNDNSLTAATNNGGFTGLEGYDPASIYGGAMIALEGAVDSNGTALPQGTAVGNLECLAIYEIIEFSQQYSQWPVTVSLKPSQIAERPMNKRSDLAKVIKHGEGAMSWLANNWRGIAEAALPVAGTVANLAGAAGIPGAGAIGTGLQFLGSML